MRQLGDFIGTLRVNRPIARGFAVPIRPIKAKKQMIKQKPDSTKKHFEETGKEIQEQVQKVQQAHPTEPVVVVTSGNNVKKVEPLSMVTREIFRFKAVFPFDLFPTEVVIEEKRILVNRRHFFFSNTVDTVPIASLMVFEITKTLFFAGIHIKGGELSAIDIEVCWFKPHDVQKAKEIVDGLYMKEKGLIEIHETDPKREVAILRTIGSADLTS